MHWKKLSLLSFALGLAATLPAAGQATRTWVSGVGDDANPCSRTAPCKTFAGAISKTAAGGEINTLDPGAFGAVTITKSISIVHNGAGEAGVLASGTNGVIINAAATDVVVLRGLDIEGIGTGLNGIRFIAGGALHVEDCTINAFRAGTASGISFEPSGAAELFVTNTIIRNSGLAGTGGGIVVKPTGGGSAKVTLERVQLLNNASGYKAHDNTMSTITNSVANGSLFNGFAADALAGGPVAILLTDSVASYNGAAGVFSRNATATVQIAGMTITGNNLGVQRALTGALLSFGTNRIFGNIMGDGTPSGPAALQ